MKYVIVRDRDDAEHGIIFPDAVVHRDVARIHRAGDVRVVSAGFVDLQYDVRCWGKSESLGGLASRPEDAVVIFNDFYGGG